MRRTLAIVVWVILLASPAQAITASWDPNPPGVPAPGDTAGYRVFYGEQSGEQTVEIEAGMATTVVIPGLQPGVRYFFIVRAYNAAGRLGPVSPEVAFTVPVVQPPNPCTFPTGSTWILVTPTGKLNKTGSGGPGSKAFITFQVASPNSPITFMSIRANGVDLPDSIVEGTRLTATGNLWFTMPTGPKTFSVYAANAANCSKDQPTGFSIGP